jgi:hypothetical protein
MGRPRQPSEAGGRAWSEARSVIGHQTNSGRIDGVSRGLATGLLSHEARS